MIFAEEIIQSRCAHCGDKCSDELHSIRSLSFCCHGCMMVYDLLNENGMGDYYRFVNNPGISKNTRSDQNFNYLDNEEIVEKLLSFNEGGYAKVTLLLPQIHCSSCLWLLEHLSMLDKGVIKSSVNFSSKQATISYNKSETSLRRIVELLARIGYNPTIQYDQLEDHNISKKYDNRLLYKLGLAGFSFGNIMLLSFPEYLGFEMASNLFYIGYINIVLSLPVLFYCSSDYFRSAYAGLKRKVFNLDFPIALGMITLFSRSVYEILSHQGEGYLDSFSGFVFFLLIGRWFQSFTYKALDFERNYKSYFPISATVKVNNEWISRSLDHIEPDDIIRILNQEIIPVDSVIQKGKGRIDYSFVTGESNLISKSINEEVFAGGCQQGESIELKVLKKVNQSHLTQLWNENVFKKDHVSGSSLFNTKVSKYFTLGILSLSLFTMLFWMQVSVSIAFTAFTSVLIVACPCALALAIPFTYGNILRLFVKKGFFLKNTETIEQIQDIDYVIFDKTGTLTDSNKVDVTFYGKELTGVQKRIIKSVCSHSAHPLSKAIVRNFSEEKIMEIDKYEDVVGSGFMSECSGHRINIGSSNFIFGSKRQQNENGVFVEFDGNYLGYFKFKHAFRKNIDSIIHGLLQRYRIAVLSGDTDQEASRIRSLIGQDAVLYFQQSPTDKLEKIKSLQAQGHKVMMIGDGLNDAGALKQANVGIVISDQVNNFSPACDVIFDAKFFPEFLQILNYLHSAKYIIHVGLVLALLYNAIGLYFAMSGQLSPVIAAILMPLSSITIIIYGVLASWLIFKYKT